MELQLDRKIANKRIFPVLIWHHQVQGVMICY
jgi:transcription termination factor Rho